MVQILPLLQALSAAAQVTPNDQSHNDLVVRQVSTGDLPAACQAPCNVVNTMENCDERLSCICASSVGPELQQCLNCLVAAYPYLYGQALTDMDTWDELCGGSLTLSDGSSSSGTPSTSTPSSGGSTSGSGGSAPGTAPKLSSATDLKTAGVFVGIVTAFIGGLMVLYP